MCLRFRLQQYNYPVVQFKRGRAVCQDEHRRRRPNDVTTLQIMQKIHKVVLDDLRLKLRELADIVGISKSTVRLILTEYLDIRKFCIRIISLLFTIEIKQRFEFVSIEWRSSQQ